MYGNKDLCGVDQTGRYEGEEGKSVKEIPGLCSFCALDIYMLSKKTKNHVHYEKRSESP